MIYTFILPMAVIFGLIFSGTGIFQWFLLMVLFLFKLFELVILCILYLKHKTFKKGYFIHSTMAVIFLLLSLYGFHKVKQYNVRTEVALHVTTLDQFYLENGYYDSVAIDNDSNIPQIFMYEFEAIIKPDSYSFSYYDGNCFFSWIYQNNSKNWFCSD
jgi:hypothetical protein